MLPDVVCVPLKTFEHKKHVVNLSDWVPYFLVLGYGCFSVWWKALTEISAKISLLTKNELIMKDPLLDSYWQLFYFIFHKGFSAVHHFLETFQTWVHHDTLPTSSVVIIWPDRIRPWSLHSPQSAKGHPPSPLPMAHTRHSHRKYWAVPPTGVGRLVSPHLVLDYTEYNRVLLLIRLKWPKLSWYKPQARRRS